MRLLYILVGLLVSMCGTLCAQLEGDIVHVHDPCVIKHGKHYYMFSTGHGIPIRRSVDMKHWRVVGRVFDKPPSWTSREVPGFKDHIWAPDIAIIKGKYHLYYSISAFGKNQSCIGLAVNTTLDPAAPGYRWEDKGVVIRSVPEKSNWNAIDPNLVFDENDNAWLVFGSFWSGIQLMRVDSSTGKPRKKSPKLNVIASRPGSTAIEAPFIVHRKGFYYLFVSFDFCARGVNSTYKIMVGRSKKIRGPYLDRTKRPMLKGGGTLLLSSYGNCRGPGHNAILQEDGQDWIIHHMYDAANNGIPTLQVRPLIWADDGWPLAGEPLKAKQSGLRTSRADLKGKWLHSVNFEKGKEISLLPNGKINDPHSPNQWTYDGKVLRLRWRKKDEPEREALEEYYVDPAGNSYVGRNNRDMVIRGLRINDKKERRLPDKPETAGGK